MDWKVDLEALTRQANSVLQDTIAFTIENPRWGCASFERTDDLRERPNVFVCMRFDEVPTAKDLERQFREAVLRFRAIGASTAIELIGFRVLLGPDELQATLWAPGKDCDNSTGRRNDPWNWLDVTPQMETEESRASVPTPTAQSVPTTRPYKRTPGGGA